MNTPYVTQLDLLRRIQPMWRDGQARRVASGKLLAETADADNAALADTAELLAHLATVDRPAYEASLARVCPAWERERGWLKLDVRCDLPQRSVPTLSTILVGMTGYDVQQVGLAARRLEQAMRDGGVPLEEAA